MAEAADTGLVQSRVATYGPVEVILRRLDCDAAIPSPPPGLEDGWRQRLEVALSTKSKSFVDMALFQLISASRLPGSGLSEIAVNASLAIVDAAAPQNEVEASLAVQMAATHCAAMAVLGRIGGGHGGDRSLAVKAAAAAKLLKAYATQVEVLRRLRSGGSQHIRVEHIHIGQNAQAVIGTVTARPLEGSRIERDPPPQTAQAPPSG